MKKVSDVAALRLIRQQLTQHHFDSAAKLLDHMGAMQAQDFAMAKWAVGLRLQIDEEKVSKALDTGEILRTHALRPTWHLVPAGDIYWMLELSKPRIISALKVNDKKLEIDRKLLVRTNRLIENLLQEKKNLGRNEITAALKKAKIPLNDNRASHILMHAEIEGLICSGNSDASKTTYALLPERVKKKKNITPEEARGKLAQRYFASHGPATLNDFVWWSGLTIKNAREALESVRSKFVSETIGDDTYWFDGSAVRSSKALSSVHLLPSYDEYLISYKLRAASMPVHLQGRTLSSNGIFWPVILKDGQVKGLWKRSIKKDIVLIEPDFFEKAHGVTKQELAKAADLFGKFLGKKAELA